MLIFIVHCVMYNEIDIITSSYERERVIIYSFDTRDAIQCEQAGKPGQTVPVAVQ